MHRLIWTCIVRLHNGYCSICGGTENAQVRLHRYACWSGPSLFPCDIRALFPRCASYYFTLHYENKPKYFTTKKWKISDKNSDIFHISVQNIDCGYSLEQPQGDGSNEYPQSVVFRRNKKNNIYPCKPQFYCIKVGFNRSKFYRHVFVMCCLGISCKSSARQSSLNFAENFKIYLLQFVVYYNFA